MNNGWFKKYEFGGIGDSNINAMTNASKKEGSSTASSHITTEGTTAVSDPGYSTNVSASNTQSTSSWGECNIFARKRLQEYQEKYIEQNHAQVLKQISLGAGEHLQMLAFFNICENETYANFEKELQKNYSDILVRDGGKSIVKEIKKILNSNSNLRKACYAEYLSG